MPTTLLEAVGICDAETCQKHLDYALSWNLPNVTRQPAREGKIAIVGGGPSISDYLHELKDYDEVWAINGTFDWLHTQGIKPDAFVACDPLKNITDYLREPRQGVKYYIASVCDPSVFQRLEGCDVRLWHCRDDELKFPQGTVGIGGGTTCATRAPFLAQVEGWRDITLYGVDSSFKEGRTHVDDRSIRSFLDDFGQHLTVSVEGRTFDTAMNLVHQSTNLATIKELFDEHKWAKFEIRTGGMLGAFLKAEMKDLDTLVRAHG